MNNRFSDSKKNDIAISYNLPTGVYYLEIIVCNYYWQGIIILSIKVFERFCNIHDIFFFFFFFWGTLMTITFHRCSNNSPSPCPLIFYTSAEYSRPQFIVLRTPFVLSDQRCLGRFKSGLNFVAYPFRSSYASEYSLIRNLIPITEYLL